MRVAHCVVVNFSIHLKEEEKVYHGGRRGRKNKVASLSSFFFWKGMTTNTWGHLLISILSTQTGHIIQQELCSVGRSHPPMGVSPSSKTVMLYLSLCFCNLYHTVFMEEWFLTLLYAETFFHFLISKQGWDVLGLEENRMRWRGRKCIVGQRWDYGVGREDQVQIQKMCWPQVVLLMCVYENSEMFLEPVLGITQSDDVCSSLLWQT